MNEHTPAAASPAIASDAAMLRDGAVQRHVHMRRALHPADLLRQHRGIVTACGTSYGMSTQVVTPPAAADRVAPSIPGQPMAELVCMWPSTRPGRTRLAAMVQRPSSAGGGPGPMAAMRSPRVAT